MDIKAKIEEIVQKIQSDEGFKTKFTQDPVKAVESLLGVDLPDEKINQLISGVKAKLSLDKAGDLFDSVKKLF
jgi:uncharacterized protein YpuA (DUF1002 family)